jgi:hypothetical protein
MLLHTVDAFKNWRQKSLPLPIKPGLQSCKQASLQNTEVEHFSTDVLLTVRSKQTLQQQQ